MRKILLGILFLIIVLFLYGCAVPTLDEEVTGEVEEVAVTGEVIKIGALAPLTGDVATIGQPMANAILLAVEEINAEGGINGMQLEVIIEDSKCLPRDSTSGMQKLTAIDKVPVVVGAVCSSATLAAVPIAQETETVLISAASTSPLITEAGDFIFRVVPSDALQGKVGAELAFDMNFRNAALLYVNNDYGVGLKDVFKREFEALGGYVVTVESHEQGGTDFRTELTKIKAKNPQTIYLVALPAEAGLLFKQMSELGLDVQVIASEAIKDSTTTEVAGEAADGTILTVPAASTGEANQEFTEAYIAKYGEEPGIFAAEAYDATKLVAIAIAQSDGTGAGIRDALVEIGTYSGASGTFTFDDNGDVVKDYDVFKIEGGEFMLQE